MTDTSYLRERAAGASPCFGGDCIRRRSVTPRPRRRDPTVAMAAAASTGETPFFIPRLESSVARLRNLARKSSSEVQARLQFGPTLTLGALRACSSPQDVGRIIDVHGASEYA